MSSIHTHPTRGYQPAPDWWTSFYDDYLAEVLLVREDEGEVDATLAFLCEELRIEPGQGMRVFDQCCGIGSLALPLAEKGVSVIGVDQSPAYVERARQSAPSGASFVAADAFEFVASPACDGAFNWWTSYGYAPTRKENRSMLARAFESLRPGGRFALDTMNLGHVLRHFEPLVVTERATPRGPIRMERASRVDLAAGRLLKRWTYFMAGEEVAQHDTSVMLSMPHDLAEDLTATGFEVVSIYGGIDRRPIDCNDARCVIVAARP